MMLPKPNIHVLKNGTIAKETINQVKRLPTEWKKRFTDYDGGLISVIHKEFKNLNKNSRNPDNMYANEMNRLFMRDEEVQTVMKDVRKMFSLLATGELQFKHWDSISPQYWGPASVGFARSRAGVCGSEKLGRGKEI